MTSYKLINTIGKVLVKEEQLYTDIMQSNNIDTYNKGNIVIVLSVVEQITPLEIMILEYATLVTLVRIK